MKLSRAQIVRVDASVKVDTAQSLLNGTNSTSGVDRSRPVVTRPVHLSSLTSFTTLMDIPEPPDPSDAPSSDDETSDADSSESSGRPWLQILANYATIVIALSAVVLSLWEGCEMRKHNRLSVLPNLDVTGTRLVLGEGEQVRYGGTPETMTERSYVLKVGIENTGLGPAVFEKALVYRAGEDTALAETKQEGDVVSFRDANSLGKRIRDRFSGIDNRLDAFEQGTLMKAGDKQYLYESLIPVSAVPDTLDALPLNRVPEMISEYSFVVCYCSVYGEDCDQEHIGAAPPDGACER